MRKVAKARRRSVPDRAVLAVAAALVAAVPAAAAQQIGAERARELNHLVRQDCGSCHGMTLKGGLGRPLLPETLAHADIETIAGVILDGIPGTPMPPWRGELSETEALWIARALKDGSIE